MRRRLASLLAASLLGTALMMLAPASPANAVGVCVGAVGSATVAPGLTYPVTATPTGIRPAVQAGFGVVFPLGTGTCVNTVGPTLKGLSATGTLSGWCGHSSGTGTTNTGEDFAYVSLGTLLVTTGELTGVVSAVPDTLAGHSCNSQNGAGGFIISGLAVKLTCMLGGLAGTTLPPLGPLGTHTIYTHVCV